MFFNKREKDCEVLELESNDSSEVIIGHTASPIGSYIVFIGGINDNDESSVEKQKIYFGTRIYDVVKEEWTEDLKIQNEEKIEKRYFHSSIVRDEIIYVFGGKSQRFFHNDIFMLDMRNMVFSNLLSTKGDSPTPRYGHSSVANKNFMFVFGGYCRNGFTHNNLFSFNFETSTWTRIKTEILPRRYFHSSVIFENDIYIINGKTKEGKPVKDVHVIDLKTMKSRNLNLVKSSKRIIPTWGQCSFIYNKKIYSFGGVGLKRKGREKYVVKTLQEFDFKKNQWLEIPFPVGGSKEKNNIGSAFGSVTIWRNHKLVFFGGIKSPTTKKKKKMSSKKEVFQNYIQSLPDEIIREILSFCDHIILSRLNCISKSNRFSLYSCEDRFWKPRIKEIEEIGILYLSIKKGNRFKPKNLKSQILDIFRQYNEFAKHHFCLEKLYNLPKKGYLHLIQNSHNYIRVLVLGDDGSGKTSMVHRLCKGSFWSEYIPGGMGENNVASITIYSKNKKKEVVPVKMVNMEFFDIIGSEYMGPIRRLSYFDLKNTVTVALICFSDPQSFQNVRNWVSELQFFCPCTPMILMNMKSDLHRDDNNISNINIEKKARELGFYFWNVCSAMTGIGLHRKFLDSIVICERLRRDKEFMGSYFKKFKSLLIDKIALENGFARGDVKGFDINSQKKYSFKLIERH